MSTTCPGSDVAITFKNCPVCGEEVELFTGDAKAKCLNCGHWVPREVAACIDWCPAAKECYKHVFEAEKEEKHDEGQ
ncbi:MAG: hypothetical protein IBX61_06215 [Thermoleophilia bacterium]|nr:hypothetical protein [Thermoleophilia bacterium]